MDSGRRPISSNRHFITRSLPAVTILVVVSFLGLAVLIAQQSDMQGTLEVSAAVTGILPPAPSAPTETAAGPWGRIECVPIVLAPPTELLPKLAEPDNEQVTWRFPNMGNLALASLLTEIRLPEDLRVHLMSLAEPDGSVNGLRIHPSRETVLGLSPEARTRLYVALQQCNASVDQRDAFRFCARSPEQWIGSAPLLPETKQLVLPLIYHHGRFLFFADLRSVGPLLASAEEQRLLVRALARDATFLLTLEVPQGAEVEQLVAYWGRGGRATDVRPLLQSLAEIEGGGRIDVCLLLPPFVRRRIYTYPVPEASRSEGHDCFWTAINFFSDGTDDLLSGPEGKEVFQRDYYRLSGDRQLGDLVFLADQHDELVHAAVYIADDIVFTKNGVVFSRPWMFMKLEDMKDYYPSSEPLKILCYRRRSL